MEESSLLAVNAPKWNLTQWFNKWGVGMCINRQGKPFPCGDGECCGDVCKAKGDLCCKNDIGYSFPCQKGGSCCGNACAAPGSKCCNKGKKGYAYPVSKDTECAEDSSVRCRNSQGKEFLCAAGNTCCGDVCAGPGSTCCNTGAAAGFPCAPGNRCCGNTCVAPGSKCCRTKGLDYAVTKATKCAGWASGSRTCINRYGSEFWCSKDSTCCGDVCAGAGSSCCKNAEGNNFVCAPGSRCGKNVCVAK